MVAAFGVLARVADRNCSLGQLLGGRGLATAAELISPTDAGHAHLADRTSPPSAGCSPRSPASTPAVDEAPP